MKSLSQIIFVDRYTHFFFTVIAVFFSFIAFFLEGLKIPFPYLFHILLLTGIVFLFFISLRLEFVSFIFSSSFQELVQLYKVIWGSYGCFFYYFIRYFLSVFRFISFVYGLYLLMFSHLFTFSLFVSLVFLVFIFGVLIDRFISFKYFKHFMRYFFLLSFAFLLLAMFIFFNFKDAFFYLSYGFSRGDFIQFLSLQLVFILPISIIDLLTAFHDFKDQKHQGFLLHTLGGMITGFFLILLFLILATVYFKGSLGQFWIETLFFLVKKSQIYPILSFFIACNFIFLIILEISLFTSIFQNMVLQLNLPIGESLKNLKGLIFFLLNLMFIFISIILSTQGNELFSIGFGIVFFAFMIFFKAKLEYYQIRMYWPTFFIPRHLFWIFSLLFLYLNIIFPLNQILPLMVFIIFIISYLYPIMRRGFSVAYQKEHQCVQDALEQFNLRNKVQFDFPEKFGILIQSSNFIQLEKLSISNAILKLAVSLAEKYGYSIDYWTKSLESLSLLLEQGERSVFMNIELKNIKQPYLLIFRYSSERIKRNKRYVRLGFLFFHPKGESHMQQNIENIYHHFIHSKNMMRRFKLCQYKKEIHSLIFSAHQ